MSVKCSNCGSEERAGLMECSRCQAVLFPTGPAAPSPARTPEYAGYLRRIPASMLDGLAMTILFGVSKAALNVAEPGIGLLTLLNWLYFTGLESSSWRGTLGKRMMGLEVVDASGAPISFLAANKRYVLKPVWMFWVWLRCAIAFVTGNRAYGQNAILEYPFLHDRLAGTLVARRAGPNART